MLLQSWDAFFRNASNGLGPGLAYQPPPGIGMKPVPYSDISIANGKAQQQDVDIQQIDIHNLIQDHLAVFSLIRGYQVIVNSSQYRGSSQNHLVDKVYRTLQLKFIPG